MTWEDQDAFALTPFTFQGSNYGYSLGGDGSANNIEKFTFASAGNASNVADLTRSVNSIAGTSSKDHGYSVGGASSDVIDRFTFATDANSVDVGDLTKNIVWSSASTSRTTGYKHGGHPNGSTVNEIEYFTFASSSNGADWGDLSVAAKYSAGVQF